mmetsp:Transcript_14052/g.42002  ORF Transcript_14052/g.42002 Transcript_14052/m.42002 type:complete len:98 (-) Transcript_14052:114-407(-)
MTFEQRRRDAAARELSGDGETDNAAADDDCVKPHVRLSWLVALSAADRRDRPSASRRVRTATPFSARLGAFELCAAYPLRGSRVRSSVCQYSIAGCA